MEPSSHSSPRLKAAQKRAEEGLAEGAVSEAKAFFQKYVADLRPGEVRPIPVSYEESWLILRYLRKIDRVTFLLEAAFVPKRPYAEWFEEESRKVKTTRR